MESRSIIDQNILSEVIQGRNEDLHREMSNLMAAGEASPDCIFTIAGMMEFCGYKFDAETFLSSNKLGKCPKIEDLLSPLERSTELFHHKQNGETIRFGPAEFIQRAKKRLEAEKAYWLARPGKETSDYCKIYDFCLTWVSELNREKLLEYWAVRVMTTTDFVNAHVSNLAKFLDPMISICLNRDIPCARLIMLHGKTLAKNHSIINFRIGNEYMDEDAVWHLLFGRNTESGIVPITFFTKEKKILDLVSYFTAIVIGLAMAGHLKEFLRLEVGPGRLIQVEEPPEVDRITFGYKNIKDYVLDITRLIPESLKTLAG